MKYLVLSLIVLAVIAAIFTFSVVGCAVAFKATRNIIFEGCRQEN